VGAIDEEAVRLRASTARRHRAAIDEICLSGKASTCLSIASSFAISDFSFSNFFLEVGLLQLHPLRGFLPIGGIQLRQVAGNTLLQLRASLLDLRPGEVLVAVLTALNLLPSRPG